MPIVLFTGVQRLARNLSPMGYESACLVEPGERISKPEEIDHLVDYDPEDPWSLEKWAAKWEKRERVAGVINRRERRILEHAILNTALGMPGVNIKQAMAMRDKLSLRLLLEERAPWLNPKFKEIQLDEEAPPLPFPFVLKPRNFFKSQLMFSCEEEKALERARGTLLHCLEEAQVRHGVRLERSFIAEEKVLGRHFSVDAMVSEGGETVFTPSVELTTAEQWGYDDMHVAVRKAPATTEAEEEKLLQRAVEDLVRALELKATPLHVDLVLGKKGVKILDAAPRIGGYRSEMMELAWGCSLDLMNLKVALGGFPRWEPRWERQVAVVELFPPKRGILLSIGGLDEIPKLPSFRRMVVRATQGQEIGLAKDGFRCALFVVLSSDDEGQLRDDVNSLRRALRWKLKGDS